MLKVSHYSRHQKTFLAKRLTYRNLDAREQNEGGVDEVRPTKTPDVALAQRKFEQGLQNTNHIDSRLAQVELSAEARAKLDAKARELRQVLERKGQQLDVKLHQDLQSHLRELENAVAKGKMHANLIDDLKKTEAASNEMQQLNARKWAQRIDSGSHILGAVAAAPVNAAVTASVSIIKGVIRAFKNK